MKLLGRIRYAQVTKRGHGRAISKLASNVNMGTDKHPRCKTYSHSDEAMPHSAYRASPHHAEWQP
jgi:hypothetical protein